MEGALLLNIVVRKSATIFQLLSGKNQALLVWRDTLLILDFSFHVINRVRRLDFERDRLSSEAGVKFLATRYGAKVEQDLRLQGADHTDAIN